MEEVLKALIYSVIFSPPFIILLLMGEVLDNYVKVLKDFSSTSTGLY